MTHFIFGIHCHQPVGNFDFVFEQAHNRSYLPFLQILNEYPSIKCAIHYSGILFDWIQKHEMKTFDLIGNLANRGQVEMMTGGYYEPILSTIPLEDRLGQIKTQSEFIEKEFGQTPRGLWLTERIWEPHLAQSLCESGVDYITVDDSHLKQSGIAQEDLYHYFITEELGYPVRVFPISEKLRYLIPFQDARETVDFLRSIHEKKQNEIVVLADDGEKFGDWPGTYEWVYDKGWLRNFFELLIENGDWIETNSFSEIIDRYSPRDKVYMATASYEEMMGWALPTPMALDYKRNRKTALDNPGLEQFFRGGFWRNFLSKYPESNRMYSKMQWVSRKVNALRDGEVKDKILRELWQGQCNCAYWHGEFGGLYLSHLRSAIYKHLITAERLMDEGSGGYSPSVSMVDYNSDGYNEILVSNKKISAYFSVRGGQMIELDLKARSFNLLDCFTRKEEHYHHILTATSSKAKPDSPSEEGIDSIHDIEKKREKDIEKKLIYDLYDRHGFIDHFFDETTGLDSFSDCTYKEIGDFIHGVYLCETEMIDHDVRVRFSRDGFVEISGEKEKVGIVKSLTIQDGEIMAHYSITNKSLKDMKLTFAVEFNFNVLAGDAPDRYYFSNQELDDVKAKSQGVTENVSLFGLRDDYQKLSVSLEFPEPVDLWRFPVETISQSVDSYELIYQSSCMVPKWSFQVKPEEQYDIRFKISVNEV